MAHVIIIVCAALLGARITRLITADQIFQPFRDFILRRWGVESQVTYFVHCPWCVGVWVAVILAVVAWFTVPGEWPVTAWWGIPGMAAGMSWLNGFTAYTAKGE